MLGLLEEREAVARVRVEGLRETAALAAAALEAAEIELERRVIAREELLDALAASAAETTVATDSGDGKVAPEVPVSTPVPVSASVPGAIVPPWREGLSVSVLSPDNQRILNMLQDRPGGEPVRAKDIAEALGIDTAVAAKVEGVRSKAKRLGERGWLLQEASGMFSAGRRLVASPAGGPSA